MGILFMCVWLYITITLAVEAPHPQHTALEFTDLSGWGSNIAVLVGILGPISTFVGGDVTCHMSEETKDASKSVPWAIVSSASAGYLMTILTTVLIVYSLGDNPSDLMGTPSGQPYQQVFYNATRSEGQTVAMVFFMLLMLLFSQITTTAASSRQMFTFARDGGLPLSRQLAKVSNTLPNDERVSNIEAGLAIDTHPLESCRRNLDDHLPSIAHSAWLSHRIQHHHIPELYRYLLIILDFDSLHVLKSFLLGLYCASAVEPGHCWLLCQPHGSFVPVAGHHHDMFSWSAASWPRCVQLDSGHIFGGCAFHHLLLSARGTCQVHFAAQSRWWPRQ